MFSAINKIINEIYPFENKNTEICRDHFHLFLGMPKAREGVTPYFYSKFSILLSLPSQNSQTLQLSYAKLLTHWHFVFNIQGHLINYKYNL